MKIRGTLSRHFFFSMCDGKGYREGKEGGIDFVLTVSLRT